MNIEYTIRIPISRNFILGNYVGEHGKGVILLKDLFPAFDCSHRLNPNHKIKDTIGIGISEMIITKENNKISFDPSQHINSKKVFMCMWNLYRDLGEKGMKNKFPNGKNIDLFRNYVCVCLKKKFPELNSECWDKKIINEFSGYIK